MGNLALLEDACEKLRHTTRAMFGGHGLFAPNGGMFAGIVTDDEIVFKLVDGPTKAELVSLGGHPWIYNGKTTMKDWIVIPEAFYDEPHELAAWARRAHALAPGKPAAKRGAPPARKASKANAAAPAPKSAAKLASTKALAAKKSAPKRASSKSAKKASKKGRG